jgi:hypothetical protein
MTNKTTTTINFKDLPKEIKDCLDSVHYKAIARVQMSDFTKFPDIESFSEDNLIKHKNYWTSDLSLSESISGTRFECHEKLDLFLDELVSKIPSDQDQCGNFTFRFEVTRDGYDSFTEESFVDYERPETQEEYQERQEKIAKSKKLQEFLPEFKKMLDEENKKNEYELESAYQKELEAVKKKFGKL